MTRQGISGRIFIRFSDKIAVSLIPNSLCSQFCCYWSHVWTLIGTCTCGFALVIGAVTGGLLAGLGLQGTLDAFNNGLGGGAKIALAYGILGAFALAWHVPVCLTCWPIK